MRHLSIKNSTLSSHCMLVGQTDGSQIIALVSPGLMPTRMLNCASGMRREIGYEVGIRDAHGWK